MKPIEQVLDIYEEELNSIRPGTEHSFPLSKELINHLLWMIERMKEQVDREKTMRWLGFIQGVLWTLGVYSLEELKEHNRGNRH